MPRPLGVDDYWVCRAPAQTWRLVAHVTFTPSGTAGGRSQQPSAPGCTDERDRELSLQEQTALGFAVLKTGVDLYAARVRLTNTGSSTIRVDPQNLPIHFGTENAAVETLDDDRFLRPVVLGPGESTSGLVTYRALIGIGGAIRAGGGEMSYEDPVIEVLWRSLLWNSRRWKAGAMSDSSEQQWWLARDGQAGGPYGEA